jgi:hypothetical protein
MYAFLSISDWLLGFNHIVACRLQQFQGAWSDFKISTLGGRGVGEEVAQIIYTHVSKYKNN